MDEKRRKILATLASAGTIAAPGLMWGMVAREPRSVGFQTDLPEIDALLLDNCVGLTAIASRPFQLDEDIELRAAISFIRRSGRNVRISTSNPSFREQRARAMQELWKVPKWVDKQIIFEPAKILHSLAMPGPLVGDPFRRAGMLIAEVNRFAKAPGGVQNYIRVLRRISETFEIPVVPSIYLGKHIEDRRLCRPNRSDVEVFLPVVDQLLLLHSCSLYRLHPEKDCSTHESTIFTQRGGNGERVDLHENVIRAAPVREFSFSGDRHFDK